jgi:hypothetical protein
MVGPVVGRIGNLNDKGTVYTSIAMALKADGHKTDSSDFCHWLRESSRSWEDSQR